MEIENFWKKSPEQKIKREIPDKFGYWFAANLPEFFYVGVTISQIQKAMPKKLFKEWCYHNRIIYCDEGGIAYEVPKGELHYEK